MLKVVLTFVPCVLEKLMRLEIDCRNVNLVACLCQQYFSLPFFDGPNIGFHLEIIATEYYLDGRLVVSRKLAAFAEMSDLG